MQRDCVKAGTKAKRKTPAKAKPASTKPAASKPAKPGSALRKSARG